jgi:hypothetical protein
LYSRLCCCETGRHAKQAVPYTTIISAIPTVSACCACSSLEWLCLLPCDDTVAASAAAAAAGDLFDGSLLLQDTGAEMWEVDKPGRKMMVVWGTDVDQFDPETQVRHQRSVTGKCMIGNCMILVTMR